VEWAGLYLADELGELALASAGMGGLPEVAHCVDLTVLAEAQDP
jgi:hypothetical protein